VGLPLDHKRSNSAGTADPAATGNIGESITETVKEDIDVR
jgi:hypothetical protein